VTLIFKKEVKKKHITDFSLSYIFDVNDYICVIRVPVIFFSFFEKLLFYKLTKSN